MTISTCIMFNLETGIDFDYYLIVPVHHIILFAIEKIIFSSEMVVFLENYYKKTIKCTLSALKCTQMHIIKSYLTLLMVVNLFVKQYICDY